jgi:hypothetical protein
VIEPLAEGRSEGALGRPVDPGAIFAGWVGLGVALVLVIAFALVIAVQSIVFIAAPLAGLLIGWYANVRAGRWRPRWRVLLNAGYAGFVTALGLAVMYVAIRLLFVYADSGVRPDRTQIDCRTGPECTYMRHVEAGREAELARQGITDAASFEAAVLREQSFAAGTLFVLALAGSLVPGGWRGINSAASSRRKDEGPDEA